MKEYILVPVLIAGFMGMATELQALGEQTSDKTIAFAEDAVNALDCAYTAQPLTDCSPDLTNHEFSEEIARTNQLLEDAKKQATHISG